MENALNNLLTSLQTHLKSMPVYTSKQNHENEYCLFNIKHTTYLSNLNKFKAIFSISWELDQKSLLFFQKFREFIDYLRSIKLIITKVEYTNYQIEGFYFY